MGFAASQVFSGELFTRKKNVFLCRIEFDLSISTTVTMGSLLKGLSAGTYREFLKTIKEQQFEERPSLDSASAILLIQILQKVQKFITFRILSKLMPKDPFHSKGIFAL